MKTRFSTLDIVAIVDELNDCLRGLRVQQVYDCDHKTYLIKFSKTRTDDDFEKEEESAKRILLIESGVRVHLTEYNWTKNTTPSSFTMKLRKHLKNKRLECIKQVGVDRILDLQFGSGEVAFHVIVELYDKGNLVITDYRYLILNILRPRRAGVDEDVRFLVKEIYPLETAKQDSTLPTEEEINSIMKSAKPIDNLRKLFNPKVIFGPSLLEHCFISGGFQENVKVRNISQSDYFKIRECLENANYILKTIAKNHKGYIIKQEEQRKIQDETNEPNVVVSFVEFHPLLFAQHENSTKMTFNEYENFNKAVDIFFSSLEGQKIDRKALHAEKEALKKLENVKSDHEKRIKELIESQELDKRRAYLIEVNSGIVEKALLVIRSAIANQMSWEDINEIIAEAQSQNDPIATRIVGLKLDKNQFTMNLTDPYEQDGISEAVDINIDLSAFANARNFYNMKRYAAKKQQKTIESSAKALKNAELKTKQTLKDVAVKTSITKARKILWFEKFFWFISSEGYLVIAGRDAQQNEMIVKRYLKPGDVYVHADLHGATSVVVKNNDPSAPIPPKTLEEAGTMAVCYSSAWDAKIVPRSWYVFHDQVSKTAPTGEYLTVGAFMIRGKKNYLPLTQLIMGFGFIFRLDEESVERRRQANSLIKQEKEESLSDNNETKENEDVEIVIDEQIEDDSEEEFPDTRVRYVSLNEDQETNEDNAESIEDKAETEVIEKEAPIILHSKEPRVKKQQKKKKSDGSKGDSEKDNKSKNHPLKRGQKGKLKKLKEKYKDQDEEERLMRMAILGSIPASDKAEGSKTKSKKEKVIDIAERIKQLQLQEQKIENTCESSEENKQMENSEDESEKKEKSQERKPNKSLDRQKKEKQKQEKQVKNEPKPNDGDYEIEDIVDEEEEEEEAGGKSNEHKRVIETLTGQPTAEDNLLFTIPVCAPYTALQYYKYKVKVLPGFHKRGKAAKTALHLFLCDKTATQREKDLLKNSKDQDLARNIPNKVKISAQNMSAIRQKK
ncbi:Nuclear export mediator factor Nemf-like protein [Dinothrombium tinctorium]|uniref:Nuclear export mediator factor Nemf-like protein n=1 Tax=Dinothrombium tinctorium TaxID=1965070 RepID=A0A3S3PKW5_9ACAR|nr:Nuclear export mediator factor Nemf-like protein [Dinothrombium tinctorium]